MTPNTTAKTTLHHELYNFVCSIIAIRKQLLKENNSLKNRMLMVKTVESLERLLIANRYDNDRLMAGFFLRHSDELEEIIPGYGSKLHEKYQEKFKYFLQRATQCYVKVKVINELAIS